ncbi:unnamed protein product [Sphagnum balticum]
MQPEGKVTIHLNFYSAFEEWSQRYEIDPFCSGTRSPPSSPSLNEALGVDQWHYGRESDVSMVEDRTGALRPAMPSKPDLQPGGILLGLTQGGTGLLATLK